MEDRLAHVQTVAREHIVEAARGHVLVSVQKYNEAFPRLAPGHELLLKFTE
jgi:hypothetical protein